MNLISNIILNTSSNILTNAIYAGAAYYTITNLSDQVFDQLGKKLNHAFDQTADSLARGASKVAEKFAENLADVINNTGDRFTKDLKFSKPAKNIGEELGRAINEFSTPALNELADVYGRFSYRLSINTLPYIVGGLILTTGTPLVVRYIYQRCIHAIGRPKLATETRKVTIFSKAYDAATYIPRSILGLVFKDKTVPPIFNQQITKRVTDYANTLRNVRKNGGFMPNLILHGPGGTGKTMIAKKIARESGMNYVAMSGGDMAQYILRREHVTELNKLFASAKKTPTILFIDECEGMVKTREKMTQAEYVEIINAFLNHTGVESKNLSIILATNRIDDIDEAVMTRMDYKIEISLPAFEQRRDILKGYIEQRFSRWELKEFFSHELVEQIANKTENFAGRTLMKLVNAIANNKSATKNNKLTKELIDSTVDEFVAQETKHRKL